MKILLTLIISFYLLMPGVLKAQDEDSNKDKDKLTSSTVSGLKFRSIGPALTSGRIIDFAVNPNDRSEYYVASAGGGVWKTVNSGTTWEPIFDSEGSYSIGCITMDPNNPHIIWVGSGENNSQRSVSYGDGVYRSEDGGKSWKNVGLKSSEHIGKIIVDPQNSNIVYVAAQGPLWGPGGDRGLYKTTDAGKTWKAILTISENTGVTDIVMDPRDPKVIYAASYQRRRRVYTLIDGGPESAIYKTTDAGETWNKLKGGLPSGDLGRIGLAISPVNPDYIFAIIEAANGRGGFFRSTNRGASWEKMSGYVARSPQYYNEIFCDPKDIDRIYSMDTYMQVTDDGGKSFHGLGERNKHVDNHAMWIDPDNTNYYLVGCDGGIYESFDRGVNWNFKSNLPVTQFYRVAADNTNPFYYVYGGTQDNFSLGGPSQTISASGIVNSDWIVTTGGDGFVSRIDPVDPNIVYSESQYGGLVRFDKKSGQQIDIQPQIGKDEPPLRWNWDSPLIISPHKHTRLYFAANKLFKSDDRGDSWTAISGDLTRQIDRNKLPVMGKVWSIDAVAKNASTSFYGTIVALAESPVKEGLIYAGTDDGLLNVTEDGGKTWRKIEHFDGVPDTTYVSYIVASQHDANTVYVAFDNHKNNDFKPYVLKSSDAGKSWEPISGNLPEKGTVYSLAEDNIKPNLLFAGTEFGVFFSVNDGKKWVQLKSGLPTVAVRDITIQTRENDLVLATFGRGFYILDDYSPLRNLSDETLKSDAKVFPVKDALMYIESTPIGMGGKGFQGASYFIADNPPYGATFTYYLKESIKTLKQKRREKEKKLIKEGKPVPYPTDKEIIAEANEKKPSLILTVYDNMGNVVRKITAPASKGIHRATWDLRYPSTRPISGNSRRGGGSGILALPGKYSVTLSKSVNGVITELTKPAEFSIMPLNIATLPAANRTALYDFQNEASKLMGKVLGTLRRAADLSDNIKAIKVTLQNTPAADKELIYSADSLEAKTNELLRKLSGDRIIASHNMNTPPSIVGRIQSAIYGMMGSTSAPTQTQRDQFKIVGEEIVPIINELKSLINVDLKNIQQQMDKLDAPWTPGRIPEWK